MSYAIRIIVAALLLCQRRGAEIIPLPREVAIDREAVAEGILPLNLRLETGEDVIFILDTGSPVTLLDRSLKSKLGKRIGRNRLRAWGATAKGGVYPAPKLFLGGTPLVTGTKILTCDFRMFSADFGRPVRGILGMDALRHYCIQIDFAAGRMRFLDSSAGELEKPGKSFPIIFLSTGQSDPANVRTFIHHEGLVGGTGSTLLIDTGLDVDGGLSPNLLEGARAPKTGQDRWFFPECTWEGAAYTNLIIRRTPGTVAGEGANVLGLRFLSRHLLTLDFPNQRLYLQPQSAGPLPTRRDREMEALLPLNGKLPEDIGARVSAFLEANNPPRWVRWLGGTVAIQRRGDSMIYHYSVGRRLKGGRWKLKKAWRADEAGHTVEKFPIP